MADLVNNMRRLVRPQNSGQVETCQSPTRYIDYAISVCNAGGSEPWCYPLPRRTRPTCSARSPTEFVQVLFNLIQNATRLWMMGRLRQKSLSMKHRADFVDFQIIDNGAGIPDEVLEKLRTPFISTKRVVPGLASLNVSYR